VTTVAGQSVVTNNERLTILFLVQGLEIGGAERQLVTLARGLRRRGHRVIVVPFYEGGPLRQGLIAERVEILDLKKAGRWDVVPFVFRLLRTIRVVKPEVIYSFLTVPNILLAAIKLLIPGGGTAWGIRSAGMDLSRYDRVIRLTYLVERILAWLPDKIIVNSRAAMSFFESQGYPADRLVAVPNGIDTDYFFFEECGRHDQREAWGFEKDDFVLGFSARLDPIKDHETFIEAVSICKKTNSRLKFVCAGGGPKNRTKNLKELTEKLNLERDLIWAGELKDMRGFYSACDAITLTSYSESFPNGIAEAMACELPPVSTDVGDCRWIVGDAGIIVPPKEPEALAQAWLQLASETKEKHVLRGEKSRQRILDNFSQDTMIAESERVLLKIAQKG